MTRLAVLVLALIAFAPTPARAQQVQRVEIVDYGIYTADVGSQQRDANGLLQSTVANVRHAATTTTVPAQLGLRFGFHYRVIGAPEGQGVELRKVVIFPPAGLKSPASAQPLQRSDSTISTTIGDTRYTGYRFDDPWELVQGTWTIQLWQGNRKLAERSFTVSAR